MQKTISLSQSDIDRIIEMAWEDRTTFADIRKQFGIQEKEVIKLMKAVSYTHLRAHET